MSTKLDTGGPAFGPKGMTLLDWFAATLPVTEKDIDAAMKVPEIVTRRTPFDSRLSAEAYVRYLKARLMLIEKRLLENGAP